MKRDDAILLMLAGFAAGCKSTSDFGMNEDRVDETRMLIEKTVPEPGRRKPMLAVADSLQHKMKEIETRALSLREGITEANRSYGTSRPELEQLYSDLGELTVHFGHVVKTHSLELRALCSQEEWRKIASHKTSLVHFTF